MGGGSQAPRDLTLTPDAEATLARTTERWRGFLAVALTELAEHPEPDGRTKFTAPAHSGYSGTLMSLVGPWRIYYRINRQTVTIILIAPVAM